MGTELPIAEQDCVVGLRSVLGQLACAQIVRPGSTDDIVAAVVDGLGPAQRAMVAELGHALEEAATSTETRT